MMKMCGVVLMVILAVMVMTEAVREFEFDQPLDPIVPGKVYLDQLGSQLTPLLQEERLHLDHRLTQLTDEGGEIDQRLRRMEARLEEKLKAFVAKKVNDLQIKLEEGLGRMVGEIAVMDTCVEDKIEVAETKIEEVTVAITNQLARLGSHEDLVQIKSKLSTAFISSIGRVTTAIENLVTVEKLEEVVGAELEVVREGCSRCEQQDTLAQISAGVTDLQDLFSLLGQQLNSTFSSCSQGCETIGQEVSRLGDESCSAASTLTQSVGRLEVDIGYIQTSLSDIHNFTQPTPEPITAITPPPPVPQVPVQPKTPCEDSTFVASKFNVCDAAVRFRKCKMLPLSYHCCRSCHTAGHISEDGPWRYLNYSRLINPIQAFQLLRRS